MARVTISTRSRNLGYGWSNQPERGRWAIVPPAAPDVVGGPRTVLTEAVRAERLNRGNDWTWDMWVGGRRLTHYYDGGAWIRVHGPGSAWGLIWLDLLREGVEVEVED